MKVVCRHLSRLGAKALWLIVVLLVLSACQNAQPDANDPKVFAQTLIRKTNATAQITRVVGGDKKYRKADDLWCIETDANTTNGQLPYLLAVWRKDGKWDGAELTDGWYEWDLYGCPR